MTDPMDALHRAISDYPREAARLADQVAAAAAATVNAEDESGQVKVTVSGNGDILSVRVTTRALRDGDTHRLAQAVTSAVNEALSRAEASLEEATTIASSDSEERFEAALQSFEQKMDATLDRLDALTRDLDSLPDH